VNKKGFAISSILYLLILITGLLFASVLGVLTFRKNVLVSRINNINAELNGDFITQYRYITEDGEWSTWLDYSDIKDINYSFDITNIPNIGTYGEQYNLTPTDVTLEIIEGKASLKFNGTSSKAFNSSGRSTIANTILLEVKKQNNGTITSFNTTTQQGIYYNSTANLNLKDSAGATTTTTATYSNSNTYKYVLVLDKTTGNYKIYENGVLQGITSSTSIFNITSVGLGYFKTDSTNFFSGSIYKAIFSTALTSSSDAIEMSKLDGSNQEDILTHGNAEIMYGPFIEYRKISAKNKLTTVDAFKTRYIRDYMNNTLTSSNNQILDIEVHARFQKSNKFYNIMVGGKYTGTYAKDRDYNNNVSLGKIRVTNGIFTHANTRNFNIASTMEILTPYTTTESFGSNLIVFIGSEPTRFPSSTNNSFSGFVVADYSDRDGNGNNEWNYYNGTTWAPFTPNSNDAIVGYITKISGSTTSVKMFTTSFTFNIALGKTISSGSGIVNDTNGRNISSIVDGVKQSATYFINGSGIQYVDIDLGAEYDVVSVKLYHQYVTAPITTLGTKTVLYSANKARTYTLWDYATKGLYIEDINGNGTNLYVSPYLMSNTHRTRYIRDDVNGRYDLTANTYDAASSWIEIAAYDYSGYNIALNKTVTTTGTNTNISRVTDGNNTDPFNAGSGMQSVIIDLRNEYAIKEVNIIHNIGNYAYLGTKTSLMSSNMDYNNVIFNNNTNEIYKEATSGIRIPSSIVTKEDETKVPSFDFAYTGSSQVYTIPITGKYRLEVWGAQGGLGYTNSSYVAVGGSGGYTKGEITLTVGDTLNIYVGGKGIDGIGSSTYAGGYNGGGTGYYYAGGGGGATDIRKGGTAFTNRIIVGGAGGGGQGYSSYISNGGYGGGTTGGTTVNNGGNGTAAGTYTTGAGTQTAGGTNSTGWNGAGSLGIGGNYYSGQSYLGGGGAGYYGGAAGAYVGAGGAGGSSYVGTLANSQTIAGNASMPNPNGGTETGHAGNGYARITYIGK
jgi:hypothetical protein